MKNRPGRQTAQPEDRDGAIRTVITGIELPGASAKSHSPRSIRAQPKAIGRTRRLPIAPVSAAGAPLDIVSAGFNS